MSTQDKYSLKKHLLEQSDLQSYYPKIRDLIMTGGESTHQGIELALSLGILTQEGEPTYRDDEDAQGRDGVFRHDWNLSFEDPSLYDLFAPYNHLDPSQVIEHNGVYIDVSGYGNEFMMTIYLFDDLPKNYYIQ